MVIGAEVVVADNREVESLVKAFDGADGVYACTTWSGSGFTADGTVKRSDDLDPTFLDDVLHRKDATCATRRWGLAACALAHMRHWLRPIATTQLALIVL